MTSKAKRKPMTEREKKERARIRAALRADGVLPPKKKPMNREAFCKEAEAFLLGDGKNIFEMWPYICWGMLEMLGKGGHFNKHRARSPEAVGVARAIKLGIRRFEFEQQHKGEEITLGDLIEATKDILHA